MRRVYFIAGLRAILNPIFLKSLIVVAFFWRSTQYVSYANVFANAPEPSHLGADVLFAQSALMHAEPATLMLLAGIAVVGSWMLADALRQKTQAYF